VGRRLVQKSQMSSNLGVTVPTPQNVAFAESLRNSKQSDIFFLQHFYIIPWISIISSSNFHTLILQTLVTEEIPSSYWIRKDHMLHWDCTHNSAQQQWLKWREANRGGLSYHGFDPTHTSVFRQSSRKPKSVRKMHQNTSFSDVVLRKFSCERHIPSAHPILHSFPTSIPPSWSLATKWAPHSLPPNKLPHFLLSALTRGQQQQTANVTDLCSRLQQSVCRAAKRSRDREISPGKGRHWHLRHTMSTHQPDHWP